MAVKKVDTQTVSTLTASGLNGKTITDVILSVHGSVVVWEIMYSGGSQFLKSKSGQYEAGGTLEFGTGTPVTLPPL